jgi:hypothetical protein
MALNCPGPFMYNRVYPEAAVLPLLVDKAIRGQDLEAILHLIHFGY